jgi:hypothetical protein
MNNNRKCSLLAIKWPGCIDMRKVRLFGKAVSPLALVGVFVAVAALVGASVILTSPTKTTNKVAIHGTEAIALYLNNAPSDTYYATDDDGVLYDWTIVTPEDLTKATITLTINKTDATAAVQWSDVGSIVANLTGTATGEATLTGSGTSFTYSSLTYTITVERLIPADTYTGTLKIVYNIPGTYTVSASVSGVTA